MGHQSTLSQLRCFKSNEQRLLLCVAMLQLLAWQPQQIHVGSDCCPQADVLRLLEHQPHRQAEFVASADVLLLMGRQAHVSIMAAVVAIYVGLLFMGLERSWTRLRCFTSKV